MRYSYREQGNTKIIIYTVVIAVVLGIAAVIMQDIQAPTEHISQTVNVNLEK